MGPCICTLRITGGGLLHHQGISFFLFAPFSPIFKSSIRVQVAQVIRAPASYCDLVDIIAKSTTIYLNRRLVMSTAAFGVRQPPTPVDVHLLPCSISHDGPAPVSSYFLLEDHHKQNSRDADASQEPSPSLDRTGGVDALEPAVVSASSSASEAQTLPPPLRAYFRGRGLEGQAVPLPDNCEGLVLSPGAAPLALAQEDIGRFYEVRHTFDAATVWQHDRDPGTDDPLHRALKWVDLASAIHDE